MTITLLKFGKDAIMEKGKYARRSEKRNAAGMRDAKKYPWTIPKVKCLVCGKEIEPRTRNGKVDLRINKCRDHRCWMRKKREDGSYRYFSHGSGVAFEVIKATKILKAAAERERQREYNKHKEEYDEQIKFFWDQMHFIGPLPPPDNTKDLPAVVRRNISKRSVRRE